jgi:hypothetical protein
VCTSFRVQVANVIRPHQLDSLGAEQPLSIQFAPVRQHLSELEVVFSRTDQTSRARKIDGIDQRVLVRRSDAVVNAVEAATAGSYSEVQIP